MGGATVHYVAAFDQRVTGVIAHTPGCGDKYLEPAGDSSDFIAMQSYWAEGDLAEEPAASIPVPFADLPTSEASVVLNFEAAREYAEIYGGYYRPSERFLKDYVGTLREVLNAWAQDLGFIFV